MRFKNQGLDVIEVQDNGSGIAPSNYASVALKHHTSKLSSYDDIASLRTFGFRGEALASLCALSTLTVTTCLADDVPRGSQLSFESSGRLSSSNLIAAQKGTTVSVEKLFHNLPVRRRELDRNIKREWPKVVALLHQYACVQTNVKFSVTQQPTKGKRVLLFSTKGNLTTRENITNIFGAKTMAALVSLDLKLELGATLTGPCQRVIPQTHSVSKEVRVLGHISRPGYGDFRQTPDRQMFFVNGRPCLLPQFAKTFNEVYRSYSCSQSPFIFANLQLDTHMYDVNVSPDKRSIMLHDQQPLLDALRASLIALLDTNEYTLPVSRPLRSKESLISLKVPDMFTTFGTERVPVHLQMDAHASSADEESKMESFTKIMTSNQHTMAFETTGLAEKVNLDQPSSFPPVVTQLNTKSNLISATLPHGDSTAYLQRGRSISPDSSVPDKRGHVQNKQHQNLVVNTADESMRAHKSKELVVGGCENDAQVAVSSRQSTFITSGRGKGSCDTESDDDTDASRLCETAIQYHERHEHRSRTLEDAENKKPTEDVISTLVDGDYNNISAIEQEICDDNYAGRASGLTTTKTELVRLLENRCSTPGAGFQPDGYALTALQPNKFETYNSNDCVSVRSSGIEIRSHSQSPASKDAAPLIAQSSTSVLSNVRLDANSPRDADEVVTHQLQGVSLPSNSKRKDFITRTSQRLCTDAAKIKFLYMHCASPFKAEYGTRDSGHARVEDINAADAESKLSLIIAKKDFARMRVAGQFNLGFIVAVRPAQDRKATSNEAGLDELFIIDQHASDEKYNFERLQHTTLLQSQQLVHPKRLELTALQEEIILENLIAIEANGFKVHMDMTGNWPVGSRCHLASLPLSREVTFDLEDLEELISLLADESSESIHIPRPSKVRRIFAMRACRSSIMIGRALTRSQMYSLLRHMGVLDKPWNCPHGRPTMRHLCRLRTWDGKGWRNDQATETLSSWRAYSQFDKNVHRT